MLKYRTLLFALSGLSFGVLVEVAAINSWRMNNPVPLDGPQTLAEVQRIAESAGLYWRSDRRDGKVMLRLIVSDHPVTDMQAGMLRFNHPHHPCWGGVVAVSIPWQSYVGNGDPEHAAIWGKMFLYGDPEILRRLLGRKE